MSCFALEPYPLLKAPKVYRGPWLSMPKRRRPQFELAMRRVVGSWGGSGCREQYWRWKFKCEFCLEYSTGYTAVADMEIEDNFYHLRLRYSLDASEFLSCWQSQQDDLLTVVRPNTSYRLIQDTFVNFFPLVLSQYSRFKNEPVLVHTTHAGVDMARVELVEGLQDSGGWRGTNSEGPHRRRFCQHGDRGIHALLVFQSKYVVRVFSKPYNKGWKCYTAISYDTRHRSGKLVPMPLQTDLLWKLIFRLNSRYSKTKNFSA